MKILIYSIITIALIAYTLTIYGDFSSFLDLPSFLITVLTTIGILLAKYGKEVFQIYKPNNQRSSVIASDGVIISILSGFLGCLNGIVLILGNLSDQAALGPGMAMAFLPLLYSLVFALVVFFPLTRIGNHE